MGPSFCLSVIRGFVAVVVVVVVVVVAVVVVAVVVVAVVSSVVVVTVVSSVVVVAVVILIVVVIVTTIRQEMGLATAMMKNEHRNRDCIHLVEITTSFIFDENITDGRTDKEMDEQR